MLGTFGNGHTQRVVEFDSCLIQQLVADIAPDVAVLNIENRDIPFTSPDNGTLTLVAQTLGIDSVREIDEKANRLKGSEKSYTFHGRDVYAYTGARLASGAITFEQVWPELPAKVVELSYQKAKATKGEVKGNIPILDIQYGNVWRISATSC